MEALKVIISLAIGAVVFFSIYLTGCAPLADKILERRLAEEQNKDVLVICIKGRANLYGGGDVTFVKTVRNFKGTVIIKECNVLISKDGVTKSEAQEIMK